MKWYDKLIGLFLVFALLVTTALSRSSFPLLKADAQVAALPIYSDGLSSGFVNWSWGASINPSNTSPVFSGTKSLAFTLSPWGALYFHSDIAQTVSSFSSLQFSLQATDANTKLKLLVYDGNNQLVSNNLPLANYGGDPVAGSWKTYTIPVKDFATPQVKGFALQDITGQNQSTVYLDEMSLLAATPSPMPTKAPTPTPPLPTVAITVPATTATIYTDQLQAGWINWSWGSSMDFGNTTTVYSGTKAIAFTPNAGWSALYLHNDVGINTASYQNITFKAKSSVMNQKFQVLLYGAANQTIGTAVPLDTFGGPLDNTTWKTYTIPFKNFSATNTTVTGFALQDTTGQGQRPIYIDDITAMQTVLAAIPSPTPVSTGFVTANNSITKNGSAVVLHGVNWFGFETGIHVVHGLWTRNWKDMITQIKALGFTAVRVPFCPTTLQGVTPGGIDYGKNPDLVNLSSLAIMDKVLTEMDHQGLYILLDEHSPDCSTITDLWYTPTYSESQWISDLQFVANRYKNLNNFVGIDLKNEPHGQATWNTGNSAIDWKPAAERAGKAVLAVNPNLLIFVEGIQDNPTCSGNTGHFWGENLEPVNCVGIDTNAIPANKLVFSPHVYGPDVYMQPYFSDPTFPNNMSSIWDTHFGYLAKKGQTVIPGEWGGKYGNGGLTQDVTWQNALVNYFKTNHICNSFYWDLNPDSNDTGGVLQDDWTTPWSNKVTMLKNYFSSCQ